MFKYTIEEVRYEFWLKSFTWILKFLFVTLLGWVVFDRVVQYELTSDIYLNFLSKWQYEQKIWALLFCLVLMVVNWFLESKKWHQFISNFGPFQTKIAVEGVLIGIASGIITPSRIGEYGGRVYNLPRGYKLKGLHANFLSSISQNLINIILGSLGGMYFIVTYLDWSKYIVGSLFIASVIFTMFFLMLYYGNYKILSLISGWAPKKLSVLIGSLANTEFMFHPNILNKALLLSLLRYLVFSFQYVLLLYFFGVEIGLAATLSGVALIYLIQSGIPLPPFLSMLARGEIALLIWSIFDVDILSVLSATFTLWMVNLLLPAMFGAIVLIRKPLNV